jgi:hypothetical protein
MAFDISPTGYFSGIIPSSTGVYIPYTALESYKVGTSGDIRQLVYSFIEAIADKYLTLPSSGTSTQMSITRSASVPSDNVVRKVYTVSMNLAFSGLAVGSE